MQSKKTLAIMVSLAIMALSVLGGRLAQGADLNSEPGLINGDFEDGLTGWGVSAQAVADSSVSKFGKKSLKLTRLTGEEGWNNASQVIAVEAGATYQIEVWTKMQNVAQTHCKIYWLDEKDKLLDITWIYTGMDGNRNWFEISRTVEAPKLVKKAQIIFLGGPSADNLNPGISWFDGIKFTKIKSTRNITPEEWKQITAAKYGPEMAASEMKEKIVYYDQRYDLAWVGGIDSLLSFLSTRGFTIKDADQLKSWMTEKIKKGADGTVCILAMGAVPDTITETMDQQCTLRRYLDAGGRIVWIGDIPLFYRSFAVQACKVWSIKEGDDPRALILGIHMGPWSLIDNKASITTVGTNWGMETVDSPVRTFLKEDATLIFSGVSDMPYACSFFKTYNPEFPYGGFIRYADGQYDGSIIALNNDLYRLALYRGKAIEVPVVVQAEKTAKAEALTLETPLRNYRRGQDITVTVKASADTNGDQIKLSVKDGNDIVKEFINPFAPESSFTIETALLASQEYTLRAEIIREGKSVAEAEKKIFLASTKTPKLPMGMYNFNGGSTEYKTNIILKDFKDHLGECGVISGGGGYLWDEALRYGLGVMPVSGAYYGAMVSKLSNPELQMRVSTGNLPKYHYGGMGAAPVCMGNPINRERINKIFQGEIREALKYPAFIKKMYISDDAGMFGDPEEHLLACYCGYCTGEFKKITGFDAPLAPAPEILKTKGVVNDNDPWYLWMKFRSHNTYGEWNSSMEKAKNEIDPEIKFGPETTGGPPVLYPQWALNPPDDFGGIGIASFYYYPQLMVPAAVFLPRSALAIMGNRDKELWVTPQSSDYAGLINDPVLHAGLVKNEFYCLLAAGVSGMTGYEYTGMPGTEAWEAMKPLAEIGTKFGPLLLNLKRKTPAVAILASYTNASYQWPDSGKDGGADLGLYLAFLKAHIPVDFVADEEINQGDLKKYQVLVLPDIDYLTRSTYNAITAFIAKGGLVFTDESCELTIPGARVTTNAGAATEVKKIITPEFDVNTPDLIATAFMGAGAQYLMFVNLRTDKATTGEITLNGPLGKYRAYDIFTGQELKNNQGKVSLTIAPAEGKLIGFYPAEIKKVSIKAPGRSLRGKLLSVKVAVQGENNGIVSALLPVRVSIRNPQGKETEYSDYYATKDGKLDISFTPARNDPAGRWEIAVKELSSGISNIVNFVLE